MTQEQIYVLFDIDQTVLERVADGSSQMFKEVFGIDASEDDIFNTGKTERQIIEEVLQTVAPHLLSRLTENLHNAYSSWAKATEQVSREKPPEVLPGIIELINLLQTHPHIVIGLLTGNSVLRAQAKLKAASIDQLFLDDNGALIGVFGDEAFYRSDLIEVACQKYNLDASQIIIVDDSLIGAQMAKELELFAILVATGSASVEQLREWSNNVFPDFDNGHASLAAELITN